jgi:cytochrome c-type biogenesis protein CcmH/NrfG
MNHARMSAQQERTVEAVRLLEQAVQLDPDGDVAYDAWLLLGQLRSTNPAWSTRAIEALQNASRLKPRKAEPWASMGEIYHRKGFETNAVACFKKALGLDPSVAIPKDVDLDAAPPAPAQAPPKKGLFGKFRSILGGPDRS